MFRTVFLLILSNIFMTYAWYGHLKTLRDKPLIIAILISWGVAFFEYCLQVPANRHGFGIFTLPQLKVMQEIITMAVFAVFAVWYMNVPVTRNFFYASMCLVGAAYFIFRDAAALP
ncbi:MAG: DMT family protein [Geovibrio sp.]|uniref:DMT family protein n=1 Tax=Geovibrio ferrireducens TaxID=46201 RepID=UPI002247F90F|nr:DMT family protein [Geovibrio ferrireducens]MCD8569063.1 DMT family protein [Geovibrio sp.]